MGKITDVVIEFLTTDKDCTLVSNEILKNDVFAIAEKHVDEIVNARGKVFEAAEWKGEIVHYIRYEGE